MVYMVYMVYGVFCAGPAEPSPNKQNFEQPTDEVSNTQNNTKATCCVVFFFSSFISQFVSLAVSIGAKAITNIKKLGNTSRPVVTRGKGNFALCSKEGRGLPGG